MSFAEFEVRGLVSEVAATLALRQEKPQVTRRRSTYYIAPTSLQHFINIGQWFR